MIWTFNAFKQASVTGTNRLQSYPMEILSHLTAMGVLDPIDVCVFQWGVVRYGDLAWIYRSGLRARTWPGGVALCLTNYTGKGERQLVYYNVPLCFQCFCRALLHVSKDVHWWKYAGLGL